MTLPEASPALTLTPIPSFIVRLHTTMPPQPQSPLLQTPASLLLPWHRWLRSPIAPELRPRLLPSLGLPLAPPFALVMAPSPQSDLLTIYISKLSCQRTLKVRNSRSFPDATSEIPVHFPHPFFTSGDSFSNPFTASLILMDIFYLAQRL